MENLVEKHNPYHIFGSKRAIIMKISKITPCNKKSGMARSFLNCC